MCLFAVLTFGQGIEAQEDSAGRKQASSDAQKGGVSGKDASTAAEEELQKAVQNPVASLISVPLQNNTNFSLGSFNRTQEVLNIQPVIPANLSENWMPITRVIQPIIWQPYPTATNGGNKRTSIKACEMRTHVRCNAAKFSPKPATCCLSHRVPMIVRQKKNRGGI